MAQTPKLNKEQYKKFHEALVAVKKMKIGQTDAIADELLIAEPTLDIMKFATTLNLMANCFSAKPNKKTTDEYKPPKMTQADFKWEAFRDRVIENIAREKATFDETVGKMEKKEELLAFIATVRIDLNPEEESTSKDMTADNTLFEMTDVYTNLKTMNRLAIMHYAFLGKMYIRLYYIFKRTFDMSVAISLGWEKFLEKCREKFPFVESANEAYKKMEVFRLLLDYPLLHLSGASTSELGEYHVALRNWIQSTHERVIRYKVNIWDGAVIRFETRYLMEDRRARVQAFMPDVRIVDSPIKGDTAEEVQKETAKLTKEFKALTMNPKNSIVAPDVERDQKLNALANQVAGKKDEWVGLMNEQDKNAHTVDPIALHHANKLHEVALRAKDEEIAQLKKGVKDEEEDEEEDEDDDEDEEEDDEPAQAVQPASPAPSSSAQPAQPVQQAQKPKPELIEVNSETEQPASPAPSSSAQPVQPAQPAQPVGKNAKKKNAKKAGGGASKPVNP